MDNIVSSITESLKSSVAPEIIIFIISAMPIIELRGGLVAASILGVPLLKAFPICVIGNMLLIPFVLLFYTKVLDFIKKTNFLWLRKPLTKLDEKTQKKSSKVDAASFLGLILFVGIPLPGTGAWTGAFVASTLKIKFGRSILAIILGVILAGIIMSILSYGLPALFSL